LILKDEIQRKNLLKKKKKKSESTGLTSQTCDLCHEIGRKKVDVF
jgi:hypothetical protein